METLIEMNSNESKEMNLIISIKQNSLSLSLIRVSFNKLSVIISRCFSKMFFFPFLFSCDDFFCCCCFISKTEEKKSVCLTAWSIDMNEIKTKPNRKNNKIQNKQNSSCVDICRGAKWRDFELGFPCFVCLYNRRSLMWLTMGIAFSFQSCCDVLEQ